MFLKSFILKKQIKKPIIKTGVTLRYIEEVFIDKINLSKLNKGIGKGKINKWF